MNISYLLVYLYIHTKKIRNNLNDNKNFGLKLIYVFIIFIFKRLRVKIYLKQKWQRMKRICKILFKSVFVLTRTWPFSSLYHLSKQLAILTFFAKWLLFKSSGLNWADTDFTCWLLLDGARMVSSDEVSFISRSIFVGGDAGTFFCFVC